MLERLFDKLKAAACNRTVTNGASESDRMWEALEKEIVRFGQFLNPLHEADENPSKEADPIIESHGEENQKEQPSNSE